MFLGGFRLEFLDLGLEGGYHQLSLFGLTLLAFLMAVKLAVNGLPAVLACSGSFGFVEILVVVIRVFRFVVVLL